MQILLLMFQHESNSFPITSQHRLLCRALASAPFCAKEAGTLCCCLLGLDAARGHVCQLPGMGVEAWEWRR